MITIEMSAIERRLRALENARNEHNQGIDARITAIVMRMADDRALVSKTIKEIAARQDAALRNYNAFTKSIAMHDAELGALRDRINAITATARAHEEIFATIHDATSGTLRADDDPPC